MLDFGHGTISNFVRLWGFFEGYMNLALVEVYKVMARGHSGESYRWVQVLCSSPYQSTPRRNPAISTTVEYVAMWTCLSWAAGKATWRRAEAHCLTT